MYEWDNGRRIQLIMKLSYAEDGMVRQSLSLEARTGDGEFQVGRWTIGVKMVEMVVG